MLIKTKLGANHKNNLKMMQNKESPLLSIKDISILAEKGFSIETIDLADGDYSRSEILTALANEWIPLLECHKCGRFSYCKYAIPLASDPNRGKEIQCGVVVNSIDNFLNVSWEKLQTYTPEQLQNYLKGLYYFSQFVFDVEMSIGKFINWDYLAWAGNEIGRFEFGFISHLRVHLDRFSSEFKELDDFKTKGRWLIVEGDAEKAFIERLGELRFNTIYVSGVEKYGGKTNATSVRFRLHVESLKNRGYTISIQGDRDNSKDNRLDQFVDDGLIEKGLTFPFSKDFEGSFPAPVLQLALHITGIEVSQEWLTERLAKSSHSPIIDMIETKIGQKINKVELARTLADIMNRNWSQILQRYQENEIVKWLLFLRTGEAS